MAKFWFQDIHVKRSDPKINLKPRVAWWPFLTNPAPTEPRHTEILPANSATLCRRGKCGFWSPERLAYGVGRSVCPHCSITTFRKRLVKYPCPGRTKGLQIRIQPIGCHHDLGRVDRPVPSESLLWASIQLRCNNALLCQKAIPIQVHLGHGEKGNMWRNCLEKSWVSRTVEHLTHLPCILADSQAISHCQKGWRNGFESGHVAVVQWILPISMALHENIWILPSASSLSRARTTCFSRAICSNGPAGLITKPSHVLISNKTIFFQLRGVPIANNTSTIGRWGSKNPRKHEPPKNSGRSPPPAWMTGGACKDFENFQHLAST